MSLGALAIGLGSLVLLWWATLVAGHLYAWKTGRIIHLNAEMMDIVRRSGMAPVFFQARKLSGADHRVLAFAGCNLGRRVVVFDEQFLILCDIDQFKFVLGHELGHHAMGHTKRSFRRLLCGQLFHGPGRLAMEQQEEAEADKFGEHLTGITRLVIDYGPLSAFYRGIGGH